MENLNAEKLFIAIKRFNKAGYSHSAIKGIKPSEVMLMFCLQKRKEPNTAGLRVSEISEILGVTSPTVTQLLKELDAKGFIERTMDQEDRRAVRIKLSKQGEVVIQEALSLTEASFNGLIQFLGEEESNQLADLLIKVCQYYEQRDLRQTESGEE
ncbi:MarR family winged helix-turn-helix transcriptional regulator [Paenibacillus antarcticus]|jgi:DNA-binding MarR family transcriptional regulator|uniref:HTH marR-type domain-containing protein n=1 Tax=Paenibacillus antarcticus TaxID=253703 RepID=A0A168QBS2_9BACL|nr:MarR family transcriptional regulator [Paenibacillus antarcticus]OAB47607.1 hypothetical protein PBAT_05165 [Paenibacillus antarcticus]